MRDNWAIGFSQRYTVGVWVGNASGAAMWNVSGTSGAAPIWASVMNYLHRSAPSSPPKVPPGLVQQEVRFRSGPRDAGKEASWPAIEAPRLEWFIKGTEQKVFTLAKFTTDKSLNSHQTSATVRITSPANGSIIALDPDIPPDKQRLVFTASGSSLRWLMNGKLFAKGSSVKWSPWPGRHVVTLVDGRGVVQDSIRLEVRGASVKERLK
jgi:penicillin-binding protein 1C